MLDDPWPEEPDDPFGDLEERVAVDIPSIEGTDVPKELFRAFWGLVAVFNLGLFALALGVLLVAFRGRLQLGGAIAVVGAAALVYGIHRYRVHRGAFAGGSGAEEGS